MCCCALCDAEVLYLTAFFSAMGYGSVVFVLLLIKTTGATEAEIVKSCRKVHNTVQCSLFGPIWAY